jgi:hypothetical protein
VPPGLLRHFLLWAWTIPKRGRQKLPTQAEKNVIEQQSDNPSEWARLRLLVGLALPHES